MKIKLAVFDPSTPYLEKLSYYLGTRYADKLELHLYSDATAAVRAVYNEPPHVFLASERFVFDRSALSEKTAVAYLTDSRDIKTLRKEKTICRFISCEEFYKQVLDLWADNNGEVGFADKNSAQCRLWVFSPISGGVGCSTAAAAFAFSRGAKQEKTLFISLEPLPSVEWFFSGAHIGSFSNLVYALKKTNTNFSAKLESCVASDASGVDFVYGPVSALHTAELTPADLGALGAKLKETEYRHVVIDAGFGFGEHARALWQVADNLIVVSGTDVRTLNRYRVAAEALENLDPMVSEKTKVLFNRVTPGFLQEYQNLFRVFGVLPLVHGEDPRDVAHKLAPKYHNFVV